MLKRLIILILLMLPMLTVDAQQCPRNIRNCRGLCGWYVDRDRDGFCDLTVNLQEILNNQKRIQDSLSQAAERRRIDSLAALNNPADTAVSTTQNNTETTGPKNGDQETIPCQKSNNAGVQDHPCPYAEQEVTPAVQIETTPTTQKTYDLFLIFGPCLVFYLLTFFLSRKNILKKSTHRKIWNVLLLITFLVTGLLGLFLVVQTNYQLMFDWFSTLLYWHVEFGIAMAAISIFHLLWHLRYWLNLFTKAKKDKPCDP